MGLEEVFKRQNENQKSVSWKLEAASQLVRGNEQISLSSVHKKTSVNRRISYTCTSIAWGAQASM